MRGDLRDNVLATTSVGRVPPRTRLGEARVRALLERAPREVRTALEPFGYYEAQVRDSLRHDGRRWQVVLDVDAGPPIRVASSTVRLVGEGSEDPVLLETVRENPITVGATLSHLAYEGLKSELGIAAADRGYLEATFDSAALRIDRRARTAHVVLHFRPGPRYTLGSVTFLQNVLDPALLQELVPWSPGDPFDGSELLTLQTALTEGPYFSAVEVVPRRDLAEDLVVPIEVRLTPARPERYAAGVGYGSDTGPRATGTAEIRRLNRRGHRAEVDGRIAAVEFRASARYALPLRGRRASLLTFSAGYVDEHPTTSDTETWLLGTNVTGLLGGWRTELGLTLQRANYDVGTQSGITSLLLLGVGLSRVRADDRLDPTRGSLLRLRLSGGPDAILGDVAIVEVAAEVRMVMSPLPWLRLRGRAEVAALEASQFSKLPGSIRYFTGGDRTVRGFAYRELGPRDADGNVIGGSRLLVGSLEAEARLRPSLGVAGFIDVGDAMSSFTDELEAGTGVGLRWRSPIGMIRIDGAFAVSRSGAPFRLHLHVGPEF